MQSRINQWAPYIGALGLALIVGAVFMGAFLPIPRREILLLVAGVGVILLAVFIFTRPRGELRAAVTGRTTIYGSNTLVLVAAFVGIVILINFLAARQWHGRWDWTAGQQHTLSPQTISVLQALKVPVLITGFFTPERAANQKDAEDRLTEYQYHTDKLTVRIIDPDENPTAAREYDIAQDGTLVFERGARREKVYFFDENGFTNAILKVTQTQQPAVYFTSGHGELSPTDAEARGMSTARNLLEQINYKVDVLNFTALTTTQTISGGLPSDISALVIASPSKPFPPEDEQRVKAYLDHGGRVLIAIDPQMDAGLKDVLATWGLTLTNDLILDPAANYRGNAAIVGMINFPTHDVTRDLNQFGVFFPGARSLQADENSPKNPTALFKTTDVACGKTDFEALKTQQQIQCEPAKDEKGPFVLGYAAQFTPSGENAQPSRLVVIGNATFAANSALTRQDLVGNQLLFSNVVNWLAGQEQLIAIPPKESNSHPLGALSGNDINFILWSNIGLLPVVSLIIGALVWWRRR